MRSSQEQTGRQMLPATTSEAGAGYQEAVCYLEELVDYERMSSWTYDPRTFNLERTRALLRKVGNPQVGLPAVHVVGTNGKGSTAALVSSILRREGLRVGLYSSPHLLSFRERIRLNGDSIPEEAVSSLVRKLVPAVEYVSRQGRGKPSFFEAYTALAFCYFRDQGVDCAVLEAGLGGRLDATRAARPRIVGFTQIGLDHSPQLGNTLREVAAEKIEMMETGSQAVAARQEPEVWDLLRATARDRGASLLRVDLRPRGDSGTVQESKKSREELESGELEVMEVEPVALSPEGSVFHLYWKKGTLRNVRLSLAGRHQFLNAGVAIGLAEVFLRERGGVSEEAIREGMETVHWPGRLEFFPGKPALLLDGAHNPSAALCLRAAIEEIWKPANLILVIGMSADKDVRQFTEVLAPLARKVIVTRARSPRALSPGEVVQRIGTGEEQVAVKEDVKEALEEARELAGTLGMVCVTGSLYLVGDVLRQTEAVGKSKEMERC